MPWEKSFDIDDAVDRATDVFWAKGYEATSLSDLLAAMGINKGSFYNAFGSKHDLFVRGLLKYGQEQHSAALADLAALNDPVQAIRKLFDFLIEQSAIDRDKKGCLLVNTALDLPNQGPGIADIVKSSMDDIETFFRRQITEGIEAGDIPNHVDPDKTAKALLGLVVGLRVLARGVFEPGDLQAIKSQAIELIS